MMRLRFANCSIALNTCSGAGGAWEAAYESYSGWKDMRVAGGCLCKAQGA